MIYDIEHSKVGSPNIFLKRNIIRGHYYKGYYIINLQSQQDFLNDLPIKHLKISEDCYNGFLSGLRDLNLLNECPYDYEAMFVSWLAEYRSIDELKNTMLLVEQLKPINYYGALLIYLNSDHLSLLKKYLKAWIECYEWSKKRDDNNIQTRDSIYSYNDFVMYKEFHSNLTNWL
ncbi:MAG: hypothetical protein V4520_18425 [Bacteroidota bacterium]